MNTQPGIQDIADALAITAERETGDGALWCPPHDGAVLRRWIPDRGSALGGGIRRMVRLARLMSAAGGGDYSRFLYMRLPALRSAHFRHELSAAAVPLRSIAHISETGVLFGEPAMALQRRQDQGFAIDFTQMPRLAALLDFLHNSLGFAAVVDMLQPVLEPGEPTAHADDAARTLHAALNGWLTPRLGSANHHRQAQRIRAFLAERGRVVPEAIDDDAILRFWMMIGVSSADDSVDGFRLYRSAASALLRYRQALIDAAAAKQLETSFGREADWGVEAGPAAAQWTSEPWQSPLHTVMSPPSRRIKWLTKKEQARLSNFLGAPEQSREAREDDDLPTEWRAGLAGDNNRFDLAFWLTLLRADVFGSAQASVVARLRKHASATAAIAEAMERIDDDAYADCATGYLTVLEQLRTEGLAALAILMEKGALEAVFLLRQFGGAEAIADVVGPFEAIAFERDELSPHLSETIASALKAAIAVPNTIPPGSTRQILLAARGVVGDVNRTGFRREDRADASMLAGLQAGAAAILDLIRELDRLPPVLAAKAAAASVSDDRDDFLSTFEHIYCGAPSHDSSA